MQNNVNEKFKEELKRFCRYLNYNMFEKFDESGIIFPNH